MINNINNENNFILLNNNSGENANNNSLINLLNEISGKDTQKENQLQLVNISQKILMSFQILELIILIIGSKIIYSVSHSYNIYIIYYYFYLQEWVRWIKTKYTKDEGKTRETGKGN